MLTVNDLLARAEIADVLQRYARAIDRVDLERVAACYHPDAWDDHNFFKGPVADYVNWLGERLRRHAATTHFFGEPLIRLASADVAQADTYCTVHQLSQPDASGRRTMTVGGLRYLDRFERRDGEWRIANRKVVFDWRYVLPLEAGRVPPFEPQWNVGRQDRGDPSYFEVGPAGGPQR